MLILMNLSVKQLQPPERCVQLKPPRAPGHVAVDGIGDEDTSPSSGSPIPSSTLPAPYVTASRVNHVLKFACLAFTVALASVGLLGGVVIDWMPSGLYHDVMLPDYALATTGGRVIASLTSPTFGGATPDQSRGKLLRSPLAALTTDISPGNCWPMAGSLGQMGVQLSRTIHLTSFTVNHPPKSILPDPTSAPRRFSVWALFEDLPPALLSRPTLLQQPPPNPTTSPFTSIHVGTFTHSIHGRSPSQSFIVPKEITSLQIPVSAVVFLFEDNWGSPDVTCIYRIQIHGVPVDLGK